MRVVLDTNILVSALIFPGGNPEAVYRLSLDHSIQLVTSATLLAELGRVLEERFGWAASRVEEAVAQIARVGDVVTPLERLTVVAADPADDRVLEAAVEGMADRIVSGDGHLLQLHDHQGVRILSAVEFLAEIRSAVRDP